MLTDWQKKQNNLKLKMILFESTTIEVLFDAYKNILRVDKTYRQNDIAIEVWDGNLILKKFTPPAMKQFNPSAEDIGKPGVDVHDNFRFPNFLANIEEVMTSHEILEKEIQTTDWS